MFLLKNVLITDPVDSACIEILQENDIAVDYKPKMPHADVVKQIESYDGLIVRSGTQVDAAILEAGKNLKIVGRAGTGVDNIDCETATNKGVIVMNTPEGNTMSAVEHTCSMMLSLFRDIPRATASLKGGAWERSKFMGNEVNGKTLAIVGLGRIGREVATRMQSFGMRTIGYDPIIPPEIAEQFGVEFLSLEEIWPLADIITVHTPLLPETKYLVNDVVFAQCKHGMRIVNVARGGIIEEAALLRALENGRCAGAALDVFEQEPPTDSALLQHEKVVCTPHLGASTKEAQLRVAKDIARQFVEFSNGQKAVGVVNAPILNLALKSENQNWSRLAEYLGKMAAAVVTSDQITNANLTLQFTGKNLNSLSELLKAATLTGILNQIDTNGTNIINSNLHAKEKGISITIEKDESEEESNSPSLILKVATNDMQLTLGGMLRGDIPLLHMINNKSFPDEIPLTRRLLTFRSENARSESSETLKEQDIVADATYYLADESVQWAIVKTSNVEADLETVNGLIADLKFDA